MDWVTNYYCVLCVPVGGGSAGAVLANQLSKNNKVLLMEAGDDPIWPHRLPVFADLPFGLGSHDWKYQTEPQKHAYFGAPNNVSVDKTGRKFRILCDRNNTVIIGVGLVSPKVATWPRGKILAGSSNLDHMLYDRCHPNDYDQWANIMGDLDWKFENLLKISTF